MVYLVKGQVLMRKFLVIILIFALLVGGFFGYKFVKYRIHEANVAEIKKGWYVEVLEEEVKVRKEANRNSSELAVAKKGDVFKAVKVENNSGNFWYNIEYESGKYGWIANPRNSNYLKDANNPEDIAAPTIKFYDDVYYADDIDSISYDHLDIWDDKDGVKVSHEVYHEVNELENKDQYWIKYTVTDQAGKTVSKVQRIEFNERPKESEVKRFSELDR